MSKNEDNKVADEIVSVFTQAAGLLREPGLRSLPMEMEAMDLLMDHMLLLGPEGIADVLSVLASDPAIDVITPAQAAAAIECCLEAEQLLDVHNRRNKAMPQEDDPFDHPLWKEAEWRTREAEAGLPDGLAGGWVGFSLAWLEWVSSRDKSSAGSSIIQLLYRKRLVTGSKVVSLSNAELERFGVTRQAKYRALTRLERAGLLAIQPRRAEDDRGQPE